jgi:molybdate transport repressor ModE-like protein
MKLKLAVQWKFLGHGTENIEPELFILLRAIRENGSLRAAAEVTDISYRHAWGLIRHWSDRISKPMVTLEKGRGAKLTAIGEKLLWAEQLINSQLSPELNKLSEVFNKEFNTLVNVRKKPDKLRINASHDLSITHLQTLCAQSGIFEIDFHFRGSLESLRELANSRCDIAGFHFPIGNISSILAPYYQQWLNADKHLLLHVFTRQQGLMTNKKNPHKISSLQSLSKRSVRFVNRQPESGTRTILDALLQQEGISKTDIKGYQDEEFTHVAVAAMVASGAVDAGFGIKAAAGKFGLHFIPLVSETYVLAIDQQTPKQVITELKKILKSRQFKTRVNTMPGYNVKQAGEELAFAKLFQEK